MCKQKKAKSTDKIRSQKVQKKKTKSADRDKINASRKKVQAQQK